MELTKMIDALYDCSFKQKLTVYWENGAIIKGFSEGINETCDCVTGSDDCDEYYMCVFRVSDIVKISTDGRKMAEIGDLIELSVMYEPIRIEMEDKRAIWEK